ncbi:MAG: beta strand repeat-containing protein [Luteolibacter sp.]
MKNKALLLATTAASLATLGSAVAQTSVVLIDDDFSSSSIITGGRFQTQNIDSGNWKGRNDATWALGSGALTNPGVTATDSDQPTHLVNTVSSADTTLTAVTVSFDYTVGTGSTLYFFSHLLTGSLDGTGNLMRMTATGGDTYAGDLITSTASQTFYNGPMFNVKDGTTAGTTNNDKADALFTHVGTGAAVQTFTKTYNIAGFVGIDSIADVSAIAAIFTADTSAAGDGAITIDNLSVTAEFAPPLPSATWDGETDANWGTNTNWLADLTPVSLDELIFTGTANAATNNNLAAGTEFNGISFTNTADGENFSLGGNSIILGGDIAQSPADSGSITDTIALNMELNGDRVVNSGTDHHLEISKVISEDGSARGLSKSGDGTLTLSAANTYSGVTSITGGILTVRNNNALGSAAGNTTVAADSALRIEGGLTIAEPMSIAGDGFVVNTGAIQNSGLNTLTGAITLEGRVRLETEGVNTGTDTLTLAGGVTSSGRTSLIGDFVFSDLPLVVSGEVRFGGDGVAGVITDKKAAFNVAGNDWTKSVIFFGGNIELGVADALPVDKGIDFGWNTYDSSNSSLDLNGFNQTVKSIQQSANSLGIGGNVNITDSVGGAVLTVDTDGPFDDSAADAEYQGRITGGLSLVKNGEGILTLNNLSSATAPVVETDPSPGPVIPNSYTGDTTVNGGTLVLNSADLDDASTVTISAGALQLDHDDFDTVDSLVFGTTPQAPGGYSADNSSGFITGTGVIFLSGGSTYSTWASTNNVSGGLLGDDDGDGNLNAIEYALDITIDGYGAAGTLTGTTMSFSKRAEAVANGDVLYSIEVSTDLGQTDPWTTVTPDTNDANTISYELPSGSEKLFGRLQVKIAP